MDSLYNLLLEPSAGLLWVWGITLTVFIIILLILTKRISHSMKIASENNGLANQYLAAVPPDRIGIINAVYQNTRKSLGIAILLTIVGGVFGYQRIYLGKRRSAFIMFLFFWTGVPSIISLFDLTAMPQTISQYNLNVVESLYNQIAAPKIEN